MIQRLDTSWVSTCISRGVIGRYLSQSSAAGPVEPHLRIVTLGAKEPAVAVEADAPPIRRAMYGDDAQRGMDLSLPCRLVLAGVEFDRGGVKVGQGERQMHQPPAAVAETDDCAVPGQKQHSGVRLEEGQGLCPWTPLEASL